MPPKKPSLYNLDKTNVAFAIAALLLTVGLIWMILQDSSREWKGWQRKFMSYVREKSVTELAAANKSINQNQMNKLVAELEQAKAAVRERKKDIQKSQKELDVLDTRQVVTKTTYQDLKQFQDSDRFYYEEHVHHHEADKAKPYQEAMAARQIKIEEWKIKLEAVEAEQQAKMAEITQWTGKVKDLERERAKLERDVMLLETKIKKNTPSIAKDILNAPMLDFLQPSLQVQQIVVEKLQDDYYFAKAQKVDRCITCHLGIDQKGFENAPQPFKSHPNLELYLSSNSAHKMEEFGCTTCHGGSGQSVSFNTAAHTPKNKEQGEEWRQKYGWKPLEFWADKMLPLNHVEASCAKCHTGTVEVPQAPKLNEGRRLATEYGCFGCHKVEGMQRWKSGPSLTHVQSKLDADWIVRWLHNPKEFRHSTKMPQIFNLENTSDPESLDKNTAAIAGIAAYLMKNSESISIAAAPKLGNAEKGKKRIEEVGCLGCHTVGTFSANHHGPELTGMGSKVKADWLFDWIKNPKHYSPGTRMPSLRLSDEDAADITAFLLADHNEKFESVRAPYVKPEVVSSMTLEFLSSGMRHEDAQKQLAEMSAESQLEFLGSKMIAHQGCYGCHDIKGFEDAKPIGTELTYEGSKDLSKFDFAFVNIPRTKQNWISQKISNPRSYDHGKVKAYFEKLKMPHFGFTDEQADALTTFVLSLQKTDIPLEMQKNLTDADRATEAGRLIVQKLNCQGCHTMDGVTGHVRAMMSDPGAMPPVLDGEGKKVKEAWLYHFLREPVTIRPWLTYRMPTFQFEDSELNSVISYFNHLSDVPVGFVAHEKPATTPEMLKHGQALFEQLQCMKCHKSNPEPGLSASFLAPDLAMTKDRIRPSWILDWLKDPATMQEGTMMPGFWPDGYSALPDILEGDSPKQIQAIRDYLMVYAPAAASSDTKAALPASKA
ncbi:MAG: c-type cytochrome [Candidatus Omnitrophica bacterium]|nr:c-type cytochrome [Candidatus Omnitrophota bacterium]